MVINCFTFSYASSIHYTWIKEVSYQTYYLMNVYRSKIEIIHNLSIIYLFSYLMYLALAILKYTFRSHSFLISNYLTIIFFITICRYFLENIKKY